MKRVVSSKSGKEIYGPKWQNIESSSDSENDEELHSAHIESTETTQVSVTDAAKPESPTITGYGDSENQIPKGKRVGSRLGESMYRAALEGDWIAAEVLLTQDPTLARDYVTEEDDRALHVAAAMNNKEFVEKLVKQMDEIDDFTLLDGRGYTACCYAAISGAVEIAHVMIEKNKNLKNTNNLATAHDENNETPLHKAALRGNKKMVSYLLKSTKIGDLSNQEWFDLLLVTIRGKMYDVAIEIVGKNGSIATMVNEEGTALHLLARQAIISNARSNSTPSPAVEFALDFLADMLDDGDAEKDPPDFGKLAGKLWGEMQKMEKARLLELIKNPNILHDAAKEGHAGLVTMLTRSYPQLIRDTDSNGYTLFHIAVKYRHMKVFDLIYQVYSLIDLRTLISQDERGDTILHLAAKLGPPNKMKLPPVLLMQRELLWFKAAEEIIPASCVMRNKDGLTPRDLFSKEHKRLLKNSENWMRNTADSCMLIATILLTVVFAAAFTVPGGYGAQTGDPILVKKHWFKVFLIFEVLGLIGSVISIVMFRSIMTSRFAENDFLSRLPTQQMFGFQALLLSLTGAFSAFMSSILLVNPKMNGLVWFGFCILYLCGSFWFLVESAATYRDYQLLRKSTRSSRHNLFHKQLPGGVIRNFFQRTGW